MTSFDNNLLTDFQNTNKKHSLRDTIRNLSSFERVVAGLLLFLIFVSGSYLMYQKNKEILIDIPRSGGKHIEGIVGTPRFINPLLAISSADKDLTALVYAGLMTRNSTGDLVPELAESFTVSEDNTVYTFTLKEGLLFHDGTPLTAKDVVYTVQQAGNASIRSPLFTNWDGVAVELIDDRTLTFTLPEPYTPFVENLTIGILPSHIWEGLTAEEFPFSQFNITPVGSGPYQVKQISRDKSGIPTNYHLTKFSEYALGTPFISSIDFVLFSNNEQAIEAYTRGEVYGISSISPIRAEALLNTEAKSNTAIHRAPQLRVYGIFFNHNKQAIFLRDEVRTALEEATPKKAVLGEILRGYGTILYSPLPSYITDISILDKTTQEVESSTSVNHVERARNILENAGWKKGDDGIYELEKNDETTRLSISFSTVNIPELEQTAERIVESWREVGVEVELKVFESTDLTQSVIRPRRFDALLFGMEIGHELDLYAFWHSSQRNDPGLNIAQYADIEADALLEKMRTEQDADVRAQLYIDFATLVQKKNSAIFLYSPDFVYIVHNRIKNIVIHPVAEPSERFDSVHLWHIETDHVWSFVKKLLER
jgi:peptide/nickel transport system substrate-binding protein